MDVAARTRSTARKESPRPGWRAAIARSVHLMAKTKGPLAGQRGGLGAETRWASSFRYAARVREGDGGGRITESMPSGGAPAERTRDRTLADRGGRSRQLEHE